MTRPRSAAGSASRVLLSLAAAVAALSAAPAAPAHGAAASLQDDAELAELLAEERREADRLRRRGEYGEALAILGQHLRDAPEDAESRALLARVHLDQASYERAEKEARRALEDALAGDAREVRALAARVLASTLLELGRAQEAIEALDLATEDLSPSTDARDAWVQGSIHAQLGQRERATRLFEIGADSPRAQDWEGLLARARCERRLGRLERANRSLIDADRAARDAGGTEPGVLVELGDLFFEADREVEEGASRSARKLYDEALALHPTHEGALLGLLELHRTNWRRTARSATELLGQALAARPDSVRALVAGTSIDLEDGRLVDVRERLARLEELAPGRREVRTLRAALAWTEHRREECEAILAALAAEDPEDSRPEREVGRHLLELYRFAEGLPFLQRAVERDPSDHEAWTQLGRSLANTGDEDSARAALARAKTEAGLRQDAWRDNTARVLERIEQDSRVDTFGQLTFVWQPDAAEVLAMYLVPFYSEAREELSARYGFTPGPVRIEVFRRHQDFSVRSTGFEGFPALGVCFGPVVTALSPLCEMRGKFSWARTSFHEFTHVIHLGLSHNRCPRWITEGLATWEESNANPAWDRNLRRDLVDALANDQIIPVRELNRAFRGPRIIFGYYQGGLVCEMLIGRFGFPSMVRLLEAFDRGLDLDQALDEVFQITPEELDRDLLRFVGEKVASLAIEPRWDPERLPRIRIALPREAPSDPAGVAAWNESWCTLAWGAWQSGRRVDAEEALRRLVGEADGPGIPRALFLRGEMALAQRENDRAVELWTRAFEAGGEDFRARVALGSILWQQGDLEAAERHFLAAERAFPGFGEAELAAERKLAALYTQQGREDEAMRALERALAYDASDSIGRVRVAGWYMERGSADRAERLYREANEVDPFARALHRDWAKALYDSGRFEEALREYGVALIVPPELDRDEPGPLRDEERAELLGRQALCLAKLGRPEDARAKAAEALALDGDCAPAREALDLTES